MHIANCIRYHESLCKRLYNVHRPIIDTREGTVRTIARLQRSTIQSSPADNTFKNNRNHN